MINLFWSIPQRFFHDAIARPELVYTFKQTLHNDGKEEAGLGTW